MISEYRRYVIYFCVGIGVFFLIYQRNALSYLTLDYIRERADHLHVLAHQNYLFSFTLFCSCFALATLFLLPITVLLTVLAGFLFGVGIGTTVVLLGAALGGTALFLIIRYCIGYSVQRQYAGLLQGFNAEIEKYGAYYLLVMQILPITPTLLINILAGISTISLWTYIWTTVIGIIPGTLLYTFAGSQLYSLDSLSSIMSGQAISILCILAFIVCMGLLLKRHRTY